MGVTDTERQTLSRRITDTHPPDATNLACLMHLTESMFTAHELQANIVLSPLLDLQRDCVRAWMKQKGISKKEVTSAMESLGRASGTVDYLDRMPR